MRAVIYHNSNVNDQQNSPRGFSFYELVGLLMTTRDLDIVAMKVMAYHWPRVP